MAYTQQSLIRTKAYKEAVISEQDVMNAGYSPEQVRKIDLKELVANKNARTILGRGFKVDIIKDRDRYEVAARRINEIIIKNDLQGIMYEMEKRVSARGVTYLTLEYFNGIPTFSLSDDFMQPQGYAKQFWKSNLAVIFKRRLFDIAEIPIIELWTEERVKRIFLRGEDEYFMPFADIQDLQVKKDLRPPEIWEHNLGFLPVWQVKNLPNWGLVADADNSAVEYFQLLLDKMVEAFYKELEKNQTRVILAASQAEIRNFGKDGSGFKNLINDYLVQFHNTSDLVQSPLNVLMGDPKIANYILGIKSLVNMYFEYCGFNGPHNIESNSNESATAALSSKSLDMETVRNKKKYRVTLLRDMIEKMIKVDEKFGVGKIFPPMENIEITIPENIPVSTDDMLRRIQTEVPLGTLSKESAISLMNDIGLNEAADRLEKIYAEQKKEIKEGLPMAAGKQFPETAGKKENEPMDKKRVDQNASAKNGG